MDRVEVNRGGGFLRAAAGERARAALLVAFTLALLLVLLHDPASASAATGSISGTVTSAETHAPIEGIEVCAISTQFLESEYSPEAPEPGSEQLSCTTTAAVGTYTISGLGAGEFVVGFANPLGGSLDYATQFYDGKSSLEEAASVTVKAGSVTPEINAQVQEGAEIGGIITDSATGAPVEAAIVCVGSAPGAPELETTCTRSGAGGAYEVLGLQPGSYELIALARGLELSFYGGATEKEATPIVLAARERRSGVNLALGPATALGGPNGNSGPTPGSTGSKPPSTGSSPSRGGGTSLLGAAPSHGVALANSFIREHDRDSLLVRLACKSSHPCRGRVALTVSRARRHDGSVHHVTVTIGSAHFSAKAGATFTVRIALRGLARSLVSDSHRLAARLRIVQGMPKPAHASVKRVLLLGARRR